MRKVVTLLTLWLLLMLGPDGVSAQQAGVLVVAHGGSRQWNDLVRDVVKRAQLEAPTEVAFGMAMHPEEVQAMQQAVDRLERRGVNRIVVVPFLVSSYSEVFRQYEYLFGIHPEAEWPEAGRPLALHVPVVMGQALDDSPVVAEVLLDRARRLSVSPAEETVIVVAHGPNGEDDNDQWLRTMQHLAQHLKRQGGFRAVEPFTIRDDAPEAIRGRAIASLRAAVQASSTQGQVLVVPLLIAQGGVEQKIPKLLAGLSYRYKPRALLPHPKMAQWIAQQATSLANASARPTERQHAALGTASLAGSITTSSEGL